MDPIPVPRPKGVRNPDRAVSSLLLAQVRHLQEAEKSLPPQYHSGIFSKAVQTEGDAARFIRAVTEAIHTAHRDAEANRAKKNAQTQTRKQWPKEGWEEWQGRTEEVAQVTGGDDALVVHCGLAGIGGSVRSRGRTTCATTPGRRTRG